MKVICMKVLKNLTPQQNLFIQYILLYCLLDKDVELVWEQLTGEEREEFQKMLSDGRIGHLLDNYTPWWKVST